MDDKFNENELELNPSVDSADEPTTAEEAKTETGYEQNDNWEFEAKASTLDETLVESDEYEIQIPQHTAEVQDSAPRPAEKKNTAAPAPSASKPQSSGGLSSNAVKFVIAGVMTVIIIGVLGILGWRYYALPNTNEQMNPGNVALTVNDTDVSIGMYNYYYSCITNNYINYAEYGYYEDLDVSKDFSNQYTTDENGKKISWEKLFQNETLNQIKYITSYYEAAVNDGLTLTKEQQKQVNENLTSIKESAAEVDMSVDQYITTNYGDYCGLATLKKMLEQCYLAETYYYKAMVDSKATDKEIDAYFAKHEDDLKNVSFAYLQFQYDDDNKDSVLKKAQACAKQIKSVKDIKKFVPNVYEDLIKSYIESGYYEDEETCAKALAEQVEVTIPKSETGLVKEAMDWLFNKDTKVNDCSTFVDDENKMVYVILKTKEPSLDEQKVYSVRHILIMPGEKDAEEQKEKYTDAEWQEAKEKAEKILKQFNSGDKSEYTFAKLAEKYSYDTESTSNGQSGKYGGLCSGVTLGTMVKSFEDWSTDSSRKYGDTDIVKSQFGYHIMFFISNEEKYRYDCASAVSKEKQDKINNDAKITKRSGMKKVKVAQPKAAEDTDAEPQQDTTQA